jgi:hypothetical protein
MITSASAFTNGAAQQSISVKGWEVIGVEPDVKVSSTDAFDAARKLAADASPSRR